MTGSQGARGRRIIVVQIGGSIIGDGEIPPPRIGSVIRFPLRFVESSPFDGDVVTVRALLKPSDRDPILQYTREDTPRRWQWDGLLHGDGWTASWRGFRPLTGQVELTGRFYADWGYDSAGRARGRVTRVQLVSERYRRQPGPQGAWEQVPGYRTLRDVDAAPRFFDSSIFLQESGEVDYEDATLIELDLDDVPELPTRSSLVPGDVSAAGELLWVADCELPLVVSLDAEHLPTEHILPGPIGPTRSIWATPTGCWVGGADGTYHCTADGIPRRVDNLSVLTGAVAGETFLSCTSESTWVLHTLGQQPIELTAPDGHPTSVVVDDGDFVVLLRHLDFMERPDIRLVRVDPSGPMTLGPALPLDARPERPYLTTSPLRVFLGEMRGGSHRI
ncbi:hypothetical protein ACWDYH_38945 [Nocardia goodfellowii]